MKNKLLPIIVLLLLIATNISSLFAQNNELRSDIIVAADGSGNYSKVQDAFNAVKDNNLKPTIIFVKAGIYKEKLILNAQKKNVSLIGESYKNTILTFDDYAKIAGGTDKSCSTLIEADDFFAENITFENTIDSRLDKYNEGGQGVALMITGDRGIFHNCKITGFQDSFFLKSNKRTYIKDCIIDGTTDFIFGSGIALFENCFIRNRKDSHITAAKQTVEKSKYGFVFKDCVILKYPGENVTNATLGRPWGAGANVVFLHSYIGSQIKADGWSVWTKEPAKNGFDNWQTTYFGEYNCFGPGFKPTSRLSWTHQLSETEALEYTKEKIFAANTTTDVKLESDWNPILKNDSCHSILPTKNVVENTIEATF
ncbi:pectinesterase family protein [Flavobacterium cellulosilyticum]|uniref:Pectinesterase n=1 Tax=Flavobacterium cellulosilyticum TaxID=2541731 RepID=A0A4R5CNR7_9FLAO|nr:pectinesterase family protein [Flavobacterium cellulosilyticum]TDD99234.1 pectin esterase [Flavobacterium cellulosilyticum]